MSTQPQPVKGLEWVEKNSFWYAEALGFTYRVAESKDLGVIVSIGWECDQNPPCDNVEDERLHYTFDFAKQVCESHHAAISSAISERDGLVRRLVEALNVAENYVEDYLETSCIAAYEEAECRSDLDTIRAVLAEARKAGE